jgi:outer membrane lipoprotein-sorting protein
MTGEAVGRGARWDGTTLRMRHQSQFSRSRRQPRGSLAAIAVAAALSLTWAHTCAQALAETVPLPRPAPKERGGPAKPQVGDIPGTPLAGTPPPPVNTPPTPILPDPRLRTVTDNGVFDANQRAQVAKISTYLSGLSTLIGNFVQVAPNGNRTTGEFYMQKPGKVRFAYDPPTPIDVVSDGTSMVVRDRKLSTQDVYPLSQTPLRYLLSDRIDLMKDTNVVSVSSDDVFITVTIEEKQALIGTSRLMLMIGTKDNQLKQWTVTDPQGYDTTVAVYNLNTQKKPDPDLFRIDFTKYDDGRGG